MTTGEQSLLGCRGGLEESYTVSRQLKVDSASAELTLEDFSSQRLQQEFRRLGAFLLPCRRVFSSRRVCEEFTNTLKHRHASDLTLGIVSLDQEHLVAFVHSPQDRDYGYTVHHTDRTLPREASRRFKVRVELHRISQDWRRESGERILLRVALEREIPRIDFEVRVWVDEREEEYAGGGGRGGSERDVRRGEGGQGSGGGENEGSHRRRDVLQSERGELGARCSFQPPRQSVMAHKVGKNALLRFPTYLRP